jgi:hypothetical protein
VIAYFALHQLGHGDIMLPMEARQEDDGQAVAQFEAPCLVSHTPINPYDGSVYYDAVACYNENGVRVKLFATDLKWVRSGEFVSISAYEP